MQPAEWVTYMILCDPSHCKPCVSLHSVNCDESAEVAPPIEQGLTYTESNVILLHACLPWYTLGQRRTLGGGIGVLLIWDDNS